MNGAAWPVRATVAFAVVAALGLAGCGGGGGSATTVDTYAVPISPHGTPTPVDVCGLVTAAETAQVLGRTWQPVGLEYGPAKVPTLQCDLGTAFARPRLSVALAVGPISAEVFEDAYGEAAGGDPQVIERLGQEAIVRQEAGQISVHVLVHGSIVTLSATLVGTSPIGKAALLALAADALTTLPSNPVVTSVDSGARCSQVPARAVAAGIGARPSLSADLVAKNGSEMCSWTALPGSAVVTVFTAPAEVAGYERLAATSAYHRVDLDLSGGTSVQVMSRADRAGDLLILTGSSAVLIDVIPTAGFSDRDVDTTPGEAALAAAAVSALT